MENRRNILVLLYNRSTRSAISFYWLAFWWIAYIKYLRPSILFPFLFYSSNNQSWVCQRIGAPHPYENTWRTNVWRESSIVDPSRERESGRKLNQIWIDKFVKMRASRSADKTYNNKCFRAREVRSLKYNFSSFISEPRKITYLIVTLQ